MFTDEEVEDFIKEFPAGTFRLDLDYDIEYKDPELRTLALESGRTIHAARRAGDVIWSFYRVE